MKLKSAVLSHLVLCVSLLSVGQLSVQTLQVISVQLQATLCALQLSLKVLYLLHLSLLLLLGLLLPPPHLLTQITQLFILAFTLTQNQKRKLTK